MNFKWNNVNALNLFYKVIPVGPQDGSQSLIKVEKLPDGSLTSKNVCGVRYVPLVNHKVENWMHIIHYH